MLLLGAFLIINHLGFPQGNQITRLSRRPESGVLDRQEVFGGLSKIQIEGCPSF